MIARKDLELLEVRERMREAQTAVAELATEVATFKFQSEHFEAVFREAEEGKKRIGELEVRQATQGRGRAGGSVGGTHAWV